MGARNRDMGKFEEEKQHLQNREGIEKGPKVHGRGSPFRCHDMLKSASKKEKRADDNILKIEIKKSENRNSGKNR